MSNQFLTDCFAELASNEKVRETFNCLDIRTKVGQNRKNSKKILFVQETSNPMFGSEFYDLKPIFQKEIVFGFFSRVENCSTDKLEAVMPFLEVENKEIAEIEKDEIWQETKDVLMNLTPRTLRELLLNEFTNALWNKGKTLEEALEIINKIYLKNIK